MIARHGRELYSSLRKRNIIIYILFYITIIIIYISIGAPVKRKTVIIHVFLGVCTSCIERGAGNNNNPYTTELHINIMNCMRFA